MDKSKRKLGLSGGVDADHTLNRVTSLHRGEKDFRFVAFLV